MPPNLLNGLSVTQTDRMRRVAFWVRLTFSLASLAFICAAVNGLHNASKYLVLNDLQSVEVEVQLLHDVCRHLMCALIALFITVVVNWFVASKYMRAAAVGEQ